MGTHHCDSAQCDPAQNATLAKNATSDVPRKLSHGSGSDPAVELPLHVWANIIDQLSPVFLKAGCLNFKVPDTSKSLGQFLALRQVPHWSV